MWHCEFTNKRKRSTNKKINANTHKYTQYEYTALVSTMRHKICMTENKIDGSFFVLSPFRVRSVSILIEVIIFSFVQIN